MEKKLIDFKVSPRWVVQSVDLAILCVSFAFSYFFIKHFEFKEIYRGHFIIYTGLFCAVVFFVFHFMRIHTGIIRYSNMQDIFRIFLAVLISSLVYALAVKMFVNGMYGIHSLDVLGVLVINFFIASSLLVLLRTTVKELFHFAHRVAVDKKEQVLICGTDEEALLLKNALDRVRHNCFHIIGFLDSSGKNKHYFIEQKKIFQLQDLSGLKTKRQVEKMLLLNEQLGGDRKKAIIDECIRLGIKLITVPPSDQWVRGKLSFSQIQDLKVEDLLQRAPIVLNNHSIVEAVTGKRVLVTGAAGSIGSELVRQLLKFHPQSLVLCDQAESFLHELQLEVGEEAGETVISPFIGSVQNHNRMEALFDEFHPQIVFHAAAYKHVPMMEANPSEAVLANVLGTKNIADLSVIYNVEKFVLVSTDKAVNPTNVMGASKRIAEMYVQCLNSFSQGILEDNHAANNSNGHLHRTVTRFITTRFGNVLGSNGSVLPRFRTQIQKGGPVTVTHPEITRYFMTIPEAVQLVLEAAAMGKGGEIYVFDMGTPVKIADLATQMIRLAGLEPDRDIKIEFSGLRAGEKLYEELLNNEETTLPTHHEKIKIANVITRNVTQVFSEVKDLLNLCNYADDMMIVKKMKEIVAEFVSNNSQYECLDKMKASNYGMEKLAVEAKAKALL